MSRWINGLNCCLIKKKTYLRVFRTTSKDTSGDVSTGYLNTDTWMNALVFSFVSFGSLSESVYKELEFKWLNWPIKM